MDLSEFVYRTFFGRLPRDYYTATSRVDVQGTPPASPHSLIQPQLATMIQLKRSLNLSFVFALVLSPSLVYAGLYPTQPVSDTTFHGGGWNEVLWKESGSSAGSTPSLDNLGRLSIDLFVDSYEAVSGCSPFYFHVCCPSPSLELHTHERADRTLPVLPPVC